MKSRHITQVITVVLLSGLLSSCATIVRGTSEPLHLNSDPPGATAKLSTGLSCTTPCALDMGRSESFNVTFSMSSCENETVSVFPILAGSGVLLGGLVDYGTGAVYSLKPNPAVATMNCTDVPAEKTASSNDPAQARLEQLNTLRNNGYLTPEEYDTKRTEILNDL